MSFEPLLGNIAPCWNCNRPNPTHMLKEVRFTKCRCGALFPSHSTTAFRKDSRIMGLPERERIILEA